MRSGGEAESEEDREKREAAWRKQMQRDNYGFKEIKILDGNVGYLDLRAFMNAGEAGETATAAMNMLQNAEAIIFDLRSNGGGDPGMIQLLTSYLYGNNDWIHLNNFYFRPSDDTTQTWTLPYVPGARNPDAEVFVLTSSYTFSAAEEFTYNLKNLERATIVGETTGGGAHPGGTRPIGERFVAFVPVGRAINPVTNTNWEGTGVSPHVSVPKEKALKVAHQLAMEKLAEKAEHEADKAYFDWYAEHLKAQNEPVELTAGELEKLAGNYGARNLLFEQGQLYYQREGRPKMELLAVDPTTFALLDDPGIRFQVEMEEGEPVALVLKRLNGPPERSERTKVKP
jgi:C-terminal processing protease CtpA/Prc